MRMRGTYFWLISCFYGLLGRILTLDNLRKITFIIVIIFAKEMGRCGLSSSAFLGFSGHKGHQIAYSSQPTLEA